MRRKLAQRIVKSCMGLALAGTMFAAGSALAAQAAIPAMGAASTSFGKTNYTGNVRVTVTLQRATPAVSSTKPLYTKVKKTANPQSSKRTSEGKLTSAGNSVKLNYLKEYEFPSTFYVHAQTSSAWTTGTTAMLTWKES